MIRKQILELVNLGPLPDSEAEAEKTGVYEDLLASISSPVTNEEACLLVQIFGSDDCYGLAWTLLHLIETTPSWPIKECLQGNNEWIDLLRTRSENAKASPHV